MSTPNAERPSPDIRRLKPWRLQLAQDGHTHLEQAIYELLWKENGAANSKDECRQARAGYHRIARQLHTNPKTIKRCLMTLCNKLSMERIPDLYDPDERARQHIETTFRVYSYRSIIQRRKSAGLTHFIRNRGGVTLCAIPATILVSPLPMGTAQLPAQPSNTLGEKTHSSGGTAPTALRSQNPQPPGGREPTVLGVQNPQPPGGRESSHNRNGIRQVSRSSPGATGLQLTPSKPADERGDDEFLEMNTLKTNVRQAVLRAFEQAGWPKPAGVVPNEIAEEMGKSGLLTNGGVTPRSHCPSGETGTA
jgi:hypothetical protein